MLDCAVNDVNAEGNKKFNFIYYGGIPLETNDDYYRYGYYKIEHIDENGDRYLLTMFKNKLPGIALTNKVSCNTYNPLKNGLCVMVPEDDDNDNYSQLWELRWNHLLENTQEIYKSYSIVNKDTNMILQTMGDGGPRYLGFVEQQKTISDPDQQHWEIVQPTSVYEGHGHVHDVGLGYTTDTEVYIKPKDKNLYLIPYLDQVLPNNIGNQGRDVTFGFGGAKYIWILKPMEIINKHQVYMIVEKTTNRALCPTSDMLDLLDDGASKWPLVLNTINLTDQKQQWFIFEYKATKIRGLEASTSKRVIFKNRETHKCITYSENSHPFNKLHLSRCTSEHNPDVEIVFTISKVG